MLRKVILTCTLATCICVLAGCGYVAGTIQRDEKGTVVFAGNWKGALVYFDGIQTPVELKPILVEDPTTGEVESTPPPLIYELEPGKHRIRISKDGQTVLDRLVFLDSGSRMEVNIP